MFLDGVGDLCQRGQALAETPALGPHPVHPILQPAARPLWLDEPLIDIPQFKPCSISLPGCQVLQIQFRQMRRLFFVEDFLGKSPELRVILPLGREATRRATRSANTVR